jgi:hypothetical protein
MHGYAAPLGFARDLYTEGRRSGDDGKYATRGGKLVGYDLHLAAAPAAPWAKPVDLMDGILNCVA